MDEKPTSTDHKHAKIVTTKQSDETIPLVSETWFAAALTMYESPLPEEFQRCIIVELDGLLAAIEPCSISSAEIRRIAAHINLIAKAKEEARIAREEAKQEAMLGDEEAIQKIQLANLYETLGQNDELVEMVNNKLAEITLKLNGLEKGCVDPSGGATKSGSWAVK